MSLCHRKVRLVSLDRLLKTLFKSTGTTTPSIMRTRATATGMTFSRQLSWKMRSRRWMTLSGHGVLHRNHYYPGTHKEGDDSC